MLKVKVLPGGLLELAVAVVPETDIEETFVGPLCLKEGRYLHLLMVLWETVFKRAALAFEICLLSES